MTLRFSKMQALGNDFVVIDAVNQSVQVSAQQIRLLADRHYGVGCDQVLLLTKAHHSSADFGYRIFNADSSESYQCGNGARCIGLWIVKKKLSAKKTIVLETVCDLLRVTYQDDAHIQVDMGQPNFDPSSLPFFPDRYTEKGITFHVVSIGNPHCVIFNDTLSENEMTSIGKQLNAQAAFPSGVNVEFVKVLSKSKIALHVYERGVGLTLACGSGACAAVAVGRKLSYLDALVTVLQPGGELQVTWPSLDTVMQLCGSANWVFDGEWLHKIHC